ncbi:MAG: hypothetical protein KAV99_05805, partial [Candidatus Latescibacteria bacterium]|nr:hypothetical protein [Candidatus Latescibacterota bacterium]
YLSGLKIVISITEIVQYLTAIFPQLSQLPNSDEVISIIITVQFLAPSSNQHVNDLCESSVSYLC